MPDMGRTEERGKKYPVSHGDLLEALRVMKGLTETTRKTVFQADLAKSNVGGGNKLTDLLSWLLVREHFVASDRLAVSQENKNSRQ